METEIPVWIVGEQVRVQGVDEKTTCGEVMEALVGTDRESWRMVERWRGVERILDDSCLLLELWTQWGDARQEVRLAVRHTGGRGRRRRASGRGLRGLVSTVLAQGQTVQGHLIRLGLAPPPRSPPPRSPPPEKDSSQSRLTSFYNRILAIDTELLHHQHKVDSLKSQLNRDFENNKRILQQEVERVQKQYDSWTKESEEIADSISRVDSWIVEKKRHVQQLCKDLQLTDIETARLVQIKESLASPKKVQSDGDSNSDTGLSSLHSSGEEGTFVTPATV